MEEEDKEGALGTLTSKAKEAKDTGEDWSEDRGVSEAWGEESVVTKAKCLPSPIRSWSLADWFREVGQWPGAEE